MVHTAIGKAAAVALTALNGVAAGAISTQHGRIATRQSTSILQSDYQNGATPPGARQGDARGQTVIINNNGGHDSNSQRPGCNSIFIGTAAVGGSFTTGWTEMPQVLGFDTKRDLVVEGNVVQPYIVETGKDATKIKRVIIMQPGLPRDYWKYAALARNSLLCASLNATANVDLDTILVAAPAWLTQADRSAGAGQENDLYFAGGGWATGGLSSGPQNTKVSSFTVLDKMTEKFFNKAEYPAVTSIYVAGHSLGGAMTQRYAVLRKESDVDANMHFFAGNPGAYTWPVTGRPVENPSDTSCASKRDDWSYGLSNLPPYASGDNRDAIAARYYKRNVVYGLGLSDHEAGDSHCEAAYQGDSHLSRGQNLEKALQELPGGVPASHHFNYVEGVAHEDYLILSDPVSQYYLFSEGIDATAPSSSSASSSSTGHTSKTSGGSSAGAASSGSSGSGASGAMSMVVSGKAGIVASALAIVGVVMPALL
ncbi:hypothetical protein ACQY0O_007690 [Thecaphora frezii]